LTNASFATSLHAVRLNERGEKEEGGTDGQRLEQQQQKQMQHEHNQGGERGTGASIQEEEGSGKSLSSCVLLLRVCGVVLAGGVCW